MNDNTARYIAGVDWGRGPDSTYFITLAENGTVVAIDQFAKTGWQTHRSRIIQLYEIWNPAVIWVEENSSGAANIEALQSEGLPVRPYLITRRSNQILMAQLRQALEQGDIIFPKGYNLDEFMTALALAWHGIQATHIHKGITMLDKSTLHDRLVEIARVESAQDGIQFIEAQREELYKQWIEPLDNQISKLKAAGNALRDSLKDELMEYIATTGDTELHKAIVFRRKTRWAYDKDQALQWAKSNAPDSVRIKESLDVRSFEKLLDAGFANGFDAEKVPTPEIAFKGVAELLEEDNE